MDQTLVSALSTLDPLTLPVSVNVALHHLRKAEQALADAVQSAPDTLIRRLPNAARPPVA